MKTILCLSFFLLTSYFVKADQLAWLNLEQAEITVNYIKEHGIKQAIFWCACCDNDQPRKIDVNNVYFRSTDAGFYEVVIEGTDEKGNMINEAVDLAYVHIPSRKKAYCLGKKLGFECSPCTTPFLWPN
jgi:hypothetical protein